MRPLSSGPGDKSSPSFGPSDDRIVFIIDGYVVDKPVGAGEIRRHTTKDFGAEKVDWTLQERLMILGADAPPPAGDGEGAPRSVYMALPGVEDLDVTEVVGDAQSMSSLPSGAGLIAAHQTSPSLSGLVKFGAEEGAASYYPNLVDGRITGVSSSPDGRRAAFAVQTSETPASFELYTFRFSDGDLRLVASLEEGTSIFGAPQWTRHGIYFVAGMKDASEGDPAGEASPSTLYRITANLESEVTLEPAAGVGEDFVASSVRASPDGERLAIIGRRDPGSQANLYVLDLTSGDLKTVTENDNMEIKTGPDDLSWSADGRSVVIVARATVSGPKVRPSSAETLLADFYNLYGVPVDEEPAEDASR